MVPDAQNVPASGRFAGPGEFAQLVRDVVALAARDGWPSMVWIDATYDDWPLGERAVIESLQAWSGKGRHLIMLANSFDEVIRRKPRFVSWRQTWDHIIECRVCKMPRASEIDSALWSPAWAMRRVDPVRSIGVANMEPGLRALLKEELNEYYRQSVPGFSATTLGL